MSEEDARTEAALEMAARLRRRQLAESAQAAVLIRSFVDDAKKAGITPIRLSARSYNGDGRYRTNIIGWYLKRDRSVGADQNGEFYVLHAPGSFTSHFVGVTLEPSEPPLELGKGGRDGESLPLADALAKRLAAGNDWPK